MPPALLFVFHAIVTLVFLAAFLIWVSQNYPLLHPSLPSPNLSVLSHAYHIIVGFFLFELSMIEPLSLL